MTYLNTAPWPAGVLSNSNQYIGIRMTSPMSSGTEQVLGELHVALTDVTDAVTCLLHTILFARAPGPVRPSEATCQAFPGVAYALCAVGDVGRKVDQAVRALEDSLASSSNFHESVYGGVSSSTSGYGYGGGARGWIVVTFFERKVKKALFGLMSNEEKVVCEKWVLPVQIVQRGGGWLLCGSSVGLRGEY